MDNIIEEIGHQYKLSNECIIEIIRVTNDFLNKDTSLREKDYYQ